MDNTYDFTALERFLKYVRINTQSDPDSDTFPSTEKQKDLGKLLVEELLKIGIADAHIDEHGYVYASIPANTDKSVPVICLCAHMDTSPDCSGKDVNPIIHENYDGSDITLPNDSTQVLKVDEHPDLKNQVGNDLITADGTTLLGADNKAGIAEVMDAVNYLLSHQEVKHGKIRILFTPDEEIGRGVDKIDMEKLGADFGYTVDGESLGSIEDETFSADEATITVNGVSVHPGFAKGKLESAIKIISEIIDHLPKDRMSPETTEGREDFVHPMKISGTTEQATVKLIIRSFEESGLTEQEDFLKELSENIVSKYPRSSVTFEVKEQYRNMKMILDEYPQVMDHAIEAIERSGLQPIKHSIRGGTDGSRLSFIGMPCPNIFTGGHAFHSKLEWISVQDMKKSVETLVNLCSIWEEKA